MCSYMPLFFNVKSLILYCVFLFAVISECQNSDTVQNTCTILYNLWGIGWGLGTSNLNICKQMAADRCPCRTLCCNPKLVLRAHQSDAW